jgi:hypothetical protein
MHMHERHLPAADLWLCNCAGPSPAQLAAANAFSEAADEGLYAFENSDATTVYSSGSNYNDDDNDDIVPAPAGRPSLM